MAAGRSAGLWLVLWLGAVLVLLGGLAIAWKTGQLDPRLWSVPAALILLVVGMWRGVRDALWMAAGMAMMILIFCWIAAARLPAPGAAFILLAAMVTAASGGACLSRGNGWRPGRPWSGVVALVLAALLIWQGGPAPVKEGRERPDLAVITALPLFWEKDARRDAPIIRLLQTRFALRPLDDPAMLAQSGARHLLLAQPRAMPPDRLVAIDAWVRVGGQALILADPMLRWTSDMPVGDRRAAPAVSLLGPLLDHWGVRMEAGRAGEVRRFIAGGRLLTLSGFGNASASCRDSHEGIVRCPIGKGQVIVVADADLIDDRLWLSDPARPLDPNAWTADTPALVAEWLGASLPGDRRWMRGVDSLMRGLRWALLGGTIWVILGATLDRRLSQRRIDAG